MSESPAVAVNRIVSRIVSADSRELLQLAKSAAISRTEMDYVDPHDGWLSCSKGVPKIDFRRDRVGDYFDKIEILDIDDRTFRLEYHVRNDAGGYWKDMIVRTLSVMRDIGAKIKTGK